MLKLYLFLLISLSVVYCTSVTNNVEDVNTAINHISPNRGSGTHHLIKRHLRNK